MFDSLQHYILDVMDILLGWLLALPRDIAIPLVAVGTALLFVLARKFATNQDLLRRCATDRKRLGKLIREAKQRRDRPSLRRLRTTRSLVSMKAFAEEWRPLFVVLLPLACLGIWAWQRLAFHPPRAGEPVEFRAEFPLSAAGRVVHLVPSSGLSAQGGWVREITVAPNSGPPCGFAAWTLSGERGAYQLTLRHDGRNYQHPLLLGEREYSVPRLPHDERLLRTEIRLAPTKWFAVVPGIETLRIPPWLMAYLALAMIALPLVKRVFRLF